MSTAQHSIIPLSTLAHAAMEATNYSPDGHIVIIDSEVGGIGEVTVHPLSWDDASRDDGERSSIALIFPRHSTDCDEVTALAAAVDSVGDRQRERGGSWDTVVAPGGVRFRIFSRHGWLDEPETDLMKNDRLDALISSFAGGPGPSAPRFRMELADQASEEWRQVLQARLENAPDAPGPLVSSLQAGSVRDAVIVWAVGDEGSDRLVPGERFTPPTRPPHSARIDAALGALADRVGQPDTVHAFACASYLAWWSGWTRLAAHLYYRARSTGQRSRLATLVWTALTRDISPHWMR